MGSRRINRRDLDAYRRTNGHETFKDQKGMIYDVTLAWFLIERCYHEQGAIWVDVASLAERCGFTQEPRENDGLLWFALPDGTDASVLEQSRLQQDIDLARPLIVLPDERVIDGYHRLYKMFLLGRKRCIAYKLTEEEVKLITGGKNV